MEGESSLSFYLLFLLLSPLPLASQGWDSIHRHSDLTIKSFTGQYPQCFPPHFLSFFHDDDTPDTVPSNKEEIRIKRKGHNDVLCYPKHNPMNYERGWCHTKVAKISSFKKMLFFREIIMCWEESRKGAGKEVGVSAAMNAFKMRTSQTAAFFVSKTTYMFFPRSCVNIM